MRCAVYHPLSGCVAEAILLGLAENIDKRQTKVLMDKKGHHRHGRSKHAHNDLLGATASSHHFSSSASSESSSHATAESSDSSGGSEAEPDFAKGGYNTTMTALPVIKNKNSRRQGKAADEFTVGHAKNEAKKRGTKKGRRQQRLTIKRRSSSPTNEYYNVRFCHEPESIIRRIHHTDILPFGFHSASYVFSTAGQHTDEGIVIGALNNTSGSGGTGPSQEVSPTTAGTGIGSMFAVAIPYVEGSTTPQKSPVVPAKALNLVLSIDSAADSTNENGDGPTRMMKQLTPQRPPVGLSGPGGRHAIKDLASGTVWRTHDTGLHPDEQLLLSKMHAMLTDAYHPFDGSEGGQLHPTSSALQPTATTAIGGVGGVAAMVSIHARYSTSLLNGIAPHLRRGSRSFEAPRGGSWALGMATGMGNEIIGVTGYSDAADAGKSNKPQLTHRGLSIVTTAPLPLPPRNLHAQDPVTSTLINIKQTQQEQQLSPKRPSASAFMLSTTSRPRGVSLQMGGGGSRASAIPPGLSTPPQLSPWPHTKGVSPTRGGTTPLAFSISNSSHGQSPPQPSLEHIMVTTPTSANGSNSGYRFLATPPAMALAVPPDIEDDIMATPQALVAAWRVSSKRHSTVLGMVSSTSTSANPTSYGLRGKLKDKPDVVDAQQAPSSTPNVVGGFTVGHPRRGHQTQLSSSSSSSVRKPFLHDNLDSGENNSGSLSISAGRGQPPHGYQESVGVGAHIIGNISDMGPDSVVTVRSPPPPQHGSLAPRRSVQLVLPDEDIIYRLGASTAMGAEELRDELLDGHEAPDRKEGSVQWAGPGHTAIATSYQRSSQPLPSALRRSSRVDASILAGTTAAAISSMPASLTPMLAYSAEEEGGGGYHNSLPIGLPSDRRVSFSSSLLLGNKPRGVGVTGTSTGGPVAVRVPLSPNTTSPRKGSTIKDEQPQSARAFVNPSIFFVAQKEEGEGGGRGPNKPSKATALSYVPPAMPSFVVVPPSILAAQSGGPATMAPTQSDYDTNRKVDITTITSGTLIDESQHPLRHAPPSFYEEAQTQRLCAIGTGVRPQTVEHLASITSSYGHKDDVDVEADMVRKAEIRRFESEKLRRATKGGNKHGKKLKDWRIPLPPSTYTAHGFGAKRGNGGGGHNVGAVVSTLDDDEVEDMDILSERADPQLNSQSLAHINPQLTVADDLTASVVAHRSLGALQLPKMLSFTYPTPPLAVGSRVLVRSKGTFSPSPVAGKMSTPTALQQNVNEITVIYDKLKLLKKEVRSLLERRQQLLTSADNSSVRYTVGGGKQSHANNNPTGMRSFADSLLTGTIGAMSGSTSVSQMQLSVEHNGGGGAPGNRSTGQHFFLNSAASSPLYHPGDASPTSDLNGPMSPTYYAFKHQGTNREANNSFGSGSKDAAAQQDTMVLFDNETLRLEAVRRHLTSRLTTLMKEAGLRHGIVVSSKYDCTYCVRYVPIDTSIDVSSTAVGQADSSGAPMMTATEEGVLHCNILLLDDADADAIAVRDVVDVVVQGLRRGVIVECLGRSAGPSFHKRKSQWLKTKRIQLASDKERKERWKGRLKKIDNSGHEMEEDELKGVGGFGTSSSSAGQHRLPPFSPFAEDAYRSFADGEEDEENLGMSKLALKSIAADEDIIFSNVNRINHKPDALNDAFLSAQTPTSSLLGRSKKRQGDHHQLSIKLPTMALGNASFQSALSDKSFLPSESPKVVHKYSPVQSPVHSPMVSSPRSAVQQLPTLLINSQPSPLLPAFSSSLPKGMLSSNGVDAPVIPINIAAGQALHGDTTAECARRFLHRHYATWKHTLRHHIANSSGSSKGHSQAQLALQRRVRQWARYNFTCVDRLSIADADSMVQCKRKLSVASKSVGLNCENGGATSSSDSESVGTSGDEEGVFRHEGRRPPNATSGGRGRSRGTAKSGLSMKGPRTNSGLVFSDTFGEMSFFAPKHDFSEDEFINSHRQSVASSSAANAARSSSQPHAGDSHRGGRSPSVSIESLGLGMASEAGDGINSYPASKLRRGAWYKVMLPPDPSTVIIVHESAIVFVKPKIGPIGLKPSVTMSTTVPPADWIPQRTTAEPLALTAPITSLPSAVTNDREFLLRLFSNHLDKEGVGFVSWSRVKKFLLEEGGCGMVGEIQDERAAEVANRGCLSASERKAAAHRLTSSLSESLHSAYQSLHIYANPSLNTVAKRTTGFFGMGASAGTDSSPAYDVGCVAGSRRHTLGFASAQLAALVDEASLAAPQVTLVQPRATSMANGAHIGSPLDRSSSPAQHPPSLLKQIPHRPTAAGGKGQQYISARAALAVQRPGAPLAQNDEYQLSFPAFEFVYYHLINVV